ncbi:MAG: bifunctional adenosylcobinamide kinase/adenosylcobinamide-phosphate guanylyltransferase [Dehalococcoidia bacterium]|nr:bifunctional adenosylcobinamide kinase/adenosylcobinamide-phosphate guanylyltransferase [Dehalococcoidia bacterium]
MGAIWFVTGGARSGKSTFAERLAANSGRLVRYVATMQPEDDELRDRIARHRAQRPEAWETVEAPTHLLDAVRDAPSEACLLLDCLSLWVSNRLLDLGTDEPSLPAIDHLERTLDAEVAAILATARRRAGSTVVVTNEVGGGLVPPYPLGRAYRDLLGRMNQHVSREADRAWLLVSGRALELPPIPEGDQ